MGEPRGFLKVERKTTGLRPVGQRLKDFREVCTLASCQHYQEQASRCMDCGTPFCHWGCPIGNYIPEWNDLVFRKHWQKAFQLLAATNNFPEITGRICSGLCEYSCVLGINDDPVTIRENELAIMEYAFKQGFIQAVPPIKRTGKKIAIIGSGPAGLACADQLNKAGHLLTVFEKADKIGGILRYGIPDFKLEKWVLERRITLLKKEGIVFKTNVCAGRELKAEYLKKEFDAICLATGSGVPRDLNIEGRDLSGIHFALDYLIQANKKVNGEKVPADKLIDGSTSSFDKLRTSPEQSRGTLTINPERAKRAEWIDAKSKRVVVIGGGDTGADCLGVAHRQGAHSVIQIELLPKPPECRTSEYPWPKYPLLLKISTSHEEGGMRDWAISTQRFIGESGAVKKLSCVRVNFDKDKKGCWLMKEVPGTEFKIEADLVILALGFLHPEKEGLIEELKIELVDSGNVKTDATFMTSIKGIFSCGDMRRGQSLVVWAIAEGRRAAHFIDNYLMGESTLPMI
jgi:glutamate synthase (NADPH/NADH) small chain